VNDVDLAATAYAHRHQNFNVSSVAIGAPEDEFRDHWDGLRPHLDGLYTNFETDARPERIDDAFPGETLSRLRRLKAEYDPDDVFNQSFPIRAGGVAAPAGAP
jgi:Berberine and berberine like